MKKSILFIVLLFTSLALNAQVAKGGAQEAPKYWNSGIATTLGFSQMSLTNWAAGGMGQLSLNAYMDLYADYQRDKLKWQNELQAGYGFLYDFSKSNSVDAYKKSNDLIILDSKFGYKAVDKLYFSVIFNFRSQFTAGEDSDHVMVSNFLAPGTLSLGLGVDYNPIKNIAINFAPLTGKMTVVTIPELRTRYGNPEDKACRFELGTQLKVDAKLEVKNFKVSTNIILFSDYLNKPQNIKVTWDVNAEAKLSKHFSFTLRTNTIYDDNVKIDKKDGREPSAGLQLREIFTLGFSYVIGNAKKK